MITQLKRGLPIVDKDGRMTQIVHIWTQNVTKLQILSGSGSPEGVVEAEQLREYMDTAGTAGNILYIKRDTDVSGDKSMGWILV